MITGVIVAAAVVAGLIGVVMKYQAGRRNVRQAMELIAYGDHGE